MKIDLRDPENVRKLIAAVNDAEAQMDLFAQPNLEDLARVHLSHRPLNRSDF